MGEKRIVIPFVVTLGISWYFYALSLSMQFSLTAFDLESGGGKISE